MNINQIAFNKIGEDVKKLKHDFSPIYNITIGTVCRKLTVQMLSHCSLLMEPAVYKNCTKK